MYLRWKKYVYTQKSKKIIRQKTNSLLRRLSPENSNKLGRHLGKFSPRDPIKVLSLVVEQVEMYGNMIVPMVDAMKYLCPLSLDVLVFVVIQKLSERRPKLKDDGQNISLWLTSLSVFCGNLGRKYSCINFEPVFHYLISSVCDNQYLDLIVLRNLIVYMTGQEVIKDLSEQQVEHLSSGIILRKVSLAKEASLDWHLEGVANLRIALENQLGSPFIIPFLVIVAQSQQSIIFGSESKNLKHIGQMYDICREILVLYVNFLCSAYSDKEYAELVPDMLLLSQKYSLDLPNVLFIHRPILNCLKPKFMHTLFDDDVILETASGNKTWKDLCGIFQKIQGARLQTPTGLYAIFWALTTNDIYVPEKKYRAEICKIAEYITQNDKNLSDWKLLNDHKYERFSDPKLPSQIQTSLTKELENRKYIIDSSRFCLETQAKTPTDRNCQLYFSAEVIASLLRECIFPRCVHSCTDAIYSFRFIMELCALDLPSHSLFHVCTEIIHNLSILLFLFTENEGTEFARFFSGIFQILHDTISQNLKAIMKSSEDFQELNALRGTIKILYKLQQQISKSVLIGLKSQEYLEFRNTLIILTKLLKYFPVIIRIGNQLVDQVENTKDSNERGDIRTMSIRYLSLIKQTKPFWITDENYISFNYKKLLDFLD